MTEAELIANDLELMFPDIPLPSLVRHAVRAAATFYRATRILRKQIKPIVAVGGENSIPLFPLEDLALVAPDSVTVNRHPLKLAGDELLLSNRYGRVRRVLYTGETLFFDGELEAGDTVEAVFITTPDVFSNELPEDTYAKWGEAIVAGAAMHLFRVASGDSYNENAALMHEKRFTEFVRRARRQGRNGESHVRRKVRYGGY